MKSLKKYIKQEKAKTGFLDENGEEIFEGDKVVDECGYKYKVVYLPEWASFALEYKDGGVKHKHFTLDTPNEYASQALTVYSRSKYKKNEIKFKDVVNKVVQEELNKRICKNCKYYLPDRKICTQVDCSQYAGGCFMPPPEFGCNMFKKKKGE